jgi:hypothetical protein
VACE